MGEGSPVLVLVVGDVPLQAALASDERDDAFVVQRVPTAAAAREVAIAHDELAVVLVAGELADGPGASVLAAFAGSHPLARRVLVGTPREPAALIAALNAGHVHHVATRDAVDELAALVQDQLGLYQAARRRARAESELARLAVDAARHAARERELEERLAQRGADLVAATVHAEQLSLRLEQVSFRDLLTGLYNHRAFQERLREEASRSQRHGTPLALLVCDLDNFSAVNRDVGHQVGDEILRRVAAILSDGDPPPRGRTSDVVARLSGEEFGVVLPETHKAGALTKALRIRDAVVGATMPGDRNVSISIGVATYPDDADDPVGLLAAATKAVRGAKQRGGGQVHFFDTAPSEPRRRPSDSIAASIAQIALPQVALDNFRPYHDRLGELVSMLQRERSLSCLLIDLSRLQRVEQELGLAHHAEVFDRAGTVLDGLRGTTLGRDDVICRTPEGDAYLVFVSRATLVTGTAVEDLAGRVETAVSQALAPVVTDLMHSEARVSVGCARVLGNSMVRTERLISRLVTEATDAARLAHQRAAQRDKTLLQDIILGDGISSVYQPIVHFGTGEVFGYEALTRGPRGSSLQSPAALFGVADEVGLTFELDRACFRRALRSAVGLEPVHRLFLNLLPLSFYDGAFIEIEIGYLLQAAGLTPANIVFEITEKLAIENFGAFRRALQAYAAMGFGVAIDDVGTRHSNLETVMALRPDFIKLSDVLTRGCSRSTVKREMVRSMANIASAIDAAIVAEGIETVDDLLCLRDLGVRYGQGYFLARPEPPFVGISADARAAMATRGASINGFSPEFDDDADLRDVPPAPRTTGWEFVAAAATRRADPATTPPWAPLVLPAGTGSLPSVVPAELAASAARPDEPSLAQTLRGDLVEPRENAPTRDPAREQDR